MIEQGSDEWFAMRLGKITASRISDVIAKGRSGEAVSRADYKLDLALERHSGIKTESISTYHMQRGTELEPQARIAYEVKTGTFVDQLDFVPHPKIEMAGASPDGLVNDDGLIEIKCPMRKNHVRYLLAGKPPAAYLPQMAWQLACTGREWCDFVSWHPDMPDKTRLFVVRYYRDEEYIAEIEAAVIKLDNEVVEIVKQLESYNEV
tara:strand:- start:5340 stop:5957 length:618 start_codon:yes stop_codon:yes gene_type:complete